MYLILGKYCNFNKRLFIVHCCETLLTVEPPTQYLDKFSTKSNLTSLAQTTPPPRSNEESNDKFLIALPVHVER